LAFDVGNAFLAALSIDQVMEASKHRFDFAKQSLEAAKARYAAGLVSINDVTRAELDYATAEMGITQVQGQVLTTYNQLGFLLNAPAPKKLAVPDFLPRATDETPLNVDQLISDAQNRRPDVNSLRMHAKAQHALIIEPELKWLPTLALTGRYSYTNEAGLTGRNFNWNAGLTMSWSIFDGLTRNGSYSERTALAYEADLDLRTALRKVDLDIHNALAILATDRAAVRQAAVALDIAQKNATQTAELYRQGLSSVLQVADANVQLFEAEVELVSQRYSLGTAYLNLESALGLDPLGKESRL
jgi:outer membrane protein TolC